MVLARPRLINVLVTCTQKKSAPAGPGQRVRDLGWGPDCKARAGDWFERLAEADAEPIEVADLYRGDHWQTARSMDDSDRQGRNKVWVCSTGFGLVSLKDRLVPYQATFSAPTKVDEMQGKSDQVGKTAAQRQEWWKALTRFHPKGVGDHPRSLQALVQQDPSAGLLVAVSPPYLSAIEEDLMAATEFVDDPDQILVISAGKSALRGPLAPYLLPVDARLRALVGGSMLSLNVRIAAHVLEKTAGRSLSRERAVSEIEEVMDSLPKFTYPERDKTSDEEVTKFIRMELEKTPKAACTPLLRKFRDSGVACEQGRFKSLYAEAKEAPLFP